MTPLFSVQQVRAMDRHAIDVLGIPGIDLMTRAATAAYRVLRARWPEARRLAVYCGAGNNGGDGYVLARLALADGLQVRVHCLLGPPAEQGDAALALRQFRDAGGLLSAVDCADLAADVHVDAVFGTGLRRAPDLALQGLFDAINQRGEPVLALDVPSGLCADSGRAYGRPLRATRTVSFIAHKRGLFTGAAAACCGCLGLEDLDLPAAVTQSHSALVYAMEDADVAPALPPRHPCAHKGEHGHVLVIGGDHGMGGAVRMAAEAAARAGAGWVSVATREAHVAALLAARPELMVHAPEGEQALAALIQRASCLVVGPGLGQGAWSRRLFGAALDSGLPAVLDADALNLLAGSAFTLGPQHVLTPHPGEAARLLGCSTADIAGNRFDAVQALARRYGCTVLLKGAGTLLAAPELPLLVCRAGNPGMASAGMGDVLAGLIGGLHAQGLGLVVPGPENAWTAALGSAALAVQVHARAADKVAEGGQRGMLATDLMPALRDLLNP